MKLSSAAIIVFIFGWSFCAQGIDADKYLNDGVEAEGTPGWGEFEFKMAFAVERNLDLAEISTIVSQEINKISQQGGFEFVSLVHGDAYHFDNFQTFGFLDVYFDTPKLDLLSLMSAYRLRYRWSHVGLYNRFKFLPFVALYHPNRCEIQLKAGYEFHVEDSTAKVTETRFEFRNESVPFNRRLDAPKSPWAKDDYIRYAQSGYFGDYKMLPTYELVKLVSEGKGVKEVNVEPMVETITSRRRSHLNVPNPWGSGPNPDQVFIITIDKTELEFANEKVLNGEKFRKSAPTFLEFEVEVDRSTLFRLEESFADQFGDVPQQLQPVLEEATRYTERAKQALQRDLFTIKNAIISLEQKMKGRRLPINYKYARMIEALK